MVSFSRLTNYHAKHSSPTSAAAVMQRKFAQDRYGSMSGLLLVMPLALKCNISSSQKFELWTKALESNSSHSKVIIRDPQRSLKRVH